MKDRFVQTVEYSNDLAPLDEKWVALQSENSLHLMIKDHNQRGWIW